MCAKLFRSCPILSDPMDSSLPGSSVHGILQTRILTWVAMPSSRGSSHPGTEPGSPAWQVDSSPSELPEKAYLYIVVCICREGNGNPLQYSCLENPMDGGAWWAAVHGISKSQTRLSGFTFTFHFPALENEMATHSSVLAWRIPGTGEPRGLTSMGSHRVGHD